MSTGLTYQAADLEEIAKHFDELAKRTEAVARNAGTRQRQMVYKAEARIWDQAAEILRSTTLAPKQKEGA